MDLAKLKDDKKLALCRWYFLAGFACLPFLWAINAVWFFSEAFRRQPAFEEQRALKKYVIGSAIGALIWVIGMTTWIIIFQVNRAAWGEFADNLSFMIPTGIP